MQSFIIYYAQKIKYNQNTIQNKSHSPKLHTDLMTGEISFKTNVSMCSKDSFHPRTQNKQISFLPSCEWQRRESDGTGRKPGSYPCPDANQIQPRAPGLN